MQESRRTRRGGDSKGCFIGCCLLSWIPSQTEQSTMRPATARQASTLLAHARSEETHQLPSTCAHAAGVSLAAFMSQE